MSSDATSSLHPEESLSLQDVQKELNTALQQPKVQQIIAAMQQARCRIGSNYFQMLECGLGAGGGYAPNYGVVLCRDQLRTSGQVRSTIMHELIHAYDDCRTGGLEWDDCKTHACAEVRAAALSGDCDWSQEAWRGHVSPAVPSTWLGYHRRCVARRAALSVALNARCGEPGCAQEAVNAVIDRCLQDKAPFVPLQTNSLLSRDVGGTVGASSGAQDKYIVIQGVSEQTFRQRLE